MTAARGAWPVVARQMFWARWKQRLNWLQEKPASSSAVLLGIGPMLVIMGWILSAAPVMAPGPMVLLVVPLAAGLAATACWFFVETPVGVATATLAWHVPHGARAAHAAFYVDALSLMMLVAAAMGFGGLFSGHGLDGLTAAFLTPFRTGMAIILAIGVGTTFASATASRSRWVQRAAHGFLLAVATVAPVGFMVGAQAGLLAAGLLPFTAIALGVLSPIPGLPLSPWLAAALLVGALFLVAMAPVGEMSNRVPFSKGLARGTAVSARAGRPGADLPRTLPAYRHDFESMAIERGPVRALQTVTRIPWLLLTVVAVVLVAAVMALPLLVFVGQNIDLPALPRINPLTALVVSYTAMVWVGALVAASDVWFPGLRGRAVSRASRTQFVPEWRRPRPTESTLRRWSAIQTMPFTREHLYDANLRTEFRLMVVLWGAPPAVIYASNWGWTATVMAALATTSLLLLGSAMIGFATERRLVSKRPSAGREAAKTLLVLTWVFGAFLSSLMLLVASEDVAGGRHLEWAVPLFLLGVAGTAVSLAFARKWLIESLVVTLRPYDGPDKSAGLLLLAGLLVGGPLSAVAAATLW